MKSKVTIGIDWDNSPVIKVEHVPSEDVRDILVDRFAMNVGTNRTGWATVRLVEVDAGKFNIVIRPVLGYELPEQAKLMQLMAGEAAAQRFVKGEIILHKGEYYQCVMADADEAVFAPIIEKTDTVKKVLYDKVMFVSQSMSDNFECSHVNPDSFTVKKGHSKA